MRGGYCHVKEKNNKISLPILALICACLLFIMYLSLSTLVPAIWSDSTTGMVASCQTATQVKFCTRCSSGVVFGVHFYSRIVKANRQLFYLLSVRL